MYNEPNWSSFTLSELLDKARQSSEKTYSGSLSTLAFLERAVDASPERTGLGEESSELLRKAQEANRTFAELQREIRNLSQEFSSSR